MPAKPAKDLYDKMMVEIGTSLFDLQILLARFVASILEEFEEKCMELDITFPFLEENGYVIYRSELIAYDPHEEAVKIKIDGKDYFVEWNDIDVASQEQIANLMHMEYVSHKIYKDLSSGAAPKDEQH
ncbi:MAG: hypothetical protein GY754_11745 [bacterium]|nr:hypothetical protein [bacterium]